MTDDEGIYGQMGLNTYARSVGMKKTANPVMGWRFFFAACMANVSALRANYGLLGVHSKTVIERMRECHPRKMDSNMFNANLLLSGIEPINK
ncbi:hypothetical protein DL346_01240 [Paenibacillus montanisoli]|uniref:Uncharacterized protein n=1 Tax=Paenibacillus montanisoli TaxID=2081970 RepID=A0A328U2X6_9BACL|nr:hypothetical protein DL346_01240 [Paenibacillus montanisoli]